MKNFILSAILLSLLAGCSYVDVALPEDPGTLIFQSEYTNYAWGYNHNGWMMTSGGEAKRFQKKASWVFPDSAGYVSEEAMLKNLAACDSVMAKVPVADFNTYAAKALACAGGPFSKAENRMADAGEQVYAFYTYDSAKKRYKRILLNMTGDWSQQNLAANASQVTDWMMKIK